MKTNNAKTDDKLANISKLDGTPMREYEPIVYVRELPAVASMMGDCAIDCINIDPLIVMSALRRELSDNLAL